MTTLLMVTIAALNFGNDHKNCFRKYLPYVHKAYKGDHGPKYDKVVLLSHGI